MLEAHAAELQTELDKLNWFHTIDFGNGAMSKGFCPKNRLDLMANAFFSEPIRGKTLLDIGCWDGFFTAAATKRGAIVTANDYFIWRQGWANRQAFEITRRELAPNVEIKEVDILDISPETVGMHDIVLFSGVLYHMRHPLLAMEAATSVAREMIIVETHMDAANEARPAMIMYPRGELYGDETNWWGPNRACVEAMLRDRGFDWIKFQPNPDLPERGIFHARRSAPG